jgi:hypothetical protein
MIDLLRLRVAQLDLQVWRLVRWLSYQNSDLYHKLLHFNDVMNNNIINLWSETTPINNSSVRPPARVDGIKITDSTETIILAILLQLSY